METNNMLTKLQAFKKAYLEDESGATAIEKRPKRAGF
jgi:hypothetical protein